VCSSRRPWLMLHCCCVSYISLIVCSVLYVLAYHILLHSLYTTIFETVLICSRCIFLVVMSVVYFWTHTHTHTHASDCIYWSLLVLHFNNIHTMPWCLVILLRRDIKIFWVKTLKCCYIGNRVKLNGQQLQIIPVNSVFCISIFQFVKIMVWHIC